VQMQVGHGRIDLCVLQVLLKVCLLVENSHVSTSSACSSALAEWNACYVK
jgi:hypothetical protein